MLTTDLISSIVEALNNLAYGIYGVGAGVGLLLVVQIYYLRKLARNH